MYKYIAKEVCKMTSLKVIEQNRGSLSRERIYDLIAKFVNRKLNKTILVRKN